MRRILLISTLGLSLAACGPLTSAGTIAPGPVAQSTTLDEQGALGAETAYKAWRLLIETGARTGLVKGQAAAWAANTDATLFRLLGKVRAAYRLGNAASLADALREFNGLAESSRGALAKVLSSPG